MNNSKKILIYGYGNPGRQDDGVGVLFAEQLNEWVKNNEIKNIDFDSNYQLNIEDAETISSYDTVFFVDASTKKEINNFEISSIKPNTDVSFTMHAVSPGFILNLCSEISKNCPEAFIIEIRGYEWEFQKSLDKRTQSNLQKTLEFAKNILKEYSIKNEIEQIDIKSFLNIKQ